MTTNLLPSNISNRLHHRRTGNTSSVPHSRREATCPIRYHRAGCFHPNLPLDLQTNHLPMRIYHHNGKNPPRQPLIRVVSHSWTRGSSNHPNPITYLQRHPLISGNPSRFFELPKARGRRTTISLLHLSCVSNPLGCDGVRESRHSLLGVLPMG